MIPLRSALSDYLSTRRSLGYKLRRTEKLLLQFIDYVEANCADRIATDLALSWARLPVGGDVSWWSSRLTVVRKFATFVNTLDPETEVPPSDLLPGRKSRRAVPFLYSDSDIAALVEAATMFTPRLRVLTCQTWVQLLAVTGMRVGEAIRLDRKDVDFDDGVLSIWMSKFGKSRELPLHASTVDALRVYLQERDRLFPNPTSPSLFISSAGTRLLYCNVSWDFIRLVRQVGLRPRSPDCRPRIHDLRHTFAIRTIIDAYKTNANVGARLASLSTYLGHVHPGHTYWYLSAAPELLGLAGLRLERSLRERS